MKGYWLILRTGIADQAAQEEYSRLWAPIAEKYRARLNPSAVPPLLKESRNTERIFLVEFPSYEIAKACYDDPDYQKARIFAQRAAKRDFLIFEGQID